MLKYIFLNKKIISLSLGFGVEQEGDRCQITKRVLPSRNKHAAGLNSSLLTNELRNELLHSKVHNIR